jgi:hypothetical protein
MFFLIIVIKRINSSFEVLLKNSAEIAVLVHEGDEHPISLASQPLF